MKAMRIPSNPQAPAEPRLEKELAIGVVIVGLIVALCFGIARYKAVQWQEFAEAHDCQVVGKMQGDVLPSGGFDAKGTPLVGTVIDSDKTSWKCDDGQTYLR